MESCDQAHKSDKQTLPPPVSPQLALKHIIKYEETAQPINGMMMFVYVSMPLPWEFTETNVLNGSVSLALQILRQQHLGDDGTNPAKHHGMH